LTDNKTGYLVGSALTLADVGLMECLLMVVDYFGEEAFHDYPHIKVSTQLSLKPIRLAIF